MRGNRNKISSVLYFIAEKARYYIVLHIVSWRLQNILV